VEGKLTKDWKKRRSIHSRIATNGFFSHNAEEDAPWLRGCSSIGRCFMNRCWLDQVELALLVLQVRNEGSNKNPF
jgi:hypothetical protein